MCRNMFSSLRSLQDDYLAEQTGYSIQKAKQLGPIKIKREL